MQGALYIPDDFSAGNPSDICQSLAKGASLQGDLCMNYISIRDNFLV